MLSSCVFCRYRTREIDVKPDIRRRIVFFLQQEKKKEKNQTIAFFDKKVFEQKIDTTALRGGRALLLQHNERR